MSKRLSSEEIVTMKVLIEKNQPNAEIARLLGVTEGAVRYRRKKGIDPERPDGRKNKKGKLHGYEAVVRAWITAHTGAEITEPVNVVALFDFLRLEYGYQASYKSVLRFVRKHYPVKAGRPKRRFESPPGVQSQTDWADVDGIHLQGEPQRLSLLIMSLSHSRYFAAIWATNKRQLSWHRCHNEAYRRLGGVAAVNRIDNLATGVAKGAGANAVLNEAYVAYSKALRFHPDPHEARSPEQKGKVERRVRAFKRRLHPGKRNFQSLEELQEWTDRRIENWAKGANCPSTGKSVLESWMDEQLHLGELPHLPEPFDIAVTRKVGEDCTVSFEGRIYGVPYRLWRQTVEVRGCSEVVQVLANGEVVDEYPRNTERRLLLHPENYEVDPHAECPPPTPLGKMGARIQEIVETPVEERPIDLYAAIAEVAG